MGVIRTCEYYNALQGCTLCVFMPKWPQTNLNYRIIGAKISQHLTYVCHFARLLKS